MHNLRGGAFLEATGIIPAMSSPLPQLNLDLLDTHHLPLAAPYPQPEEFIARNSDVEPPGWYDDTSWHL